ncbi:hypothetical protein KEM52_006224 [Ascosphaera acerosa]|nr:hypothetical protein KEM52_006224 [Ascosphaera acerosa]
MDQESGTDPQYDGLLFDAFFPVSDLTNSVREHLMNAGDKPLLFGDGSFKLVSVRMAESYFLRWLTYVWDTVITALTTVAPERIVKGRKFTVLDDAAMDDNSRPDIVITLGDILNPHELVGRGTRIFRGQQRDRKVTLKESFHIPVHVTEAQVIKSIHDKETCPHVPEVIASDQHFVYQYHPKGIPCKTRTRLVFEGHFKDIRQSDKPGSLLIAVRGALNGETNIAWSREVMRTFVKDPIKDATPFYANLAGLLAPLSQLMLESGVAPEERIERFKHIIDKALRGSYKRLGDASLVILPGGYVVRDRDDVQPASSPDRSPERSPSPSDKRANRKRKRAE